MSGSMSTEVKVERMCIEPVKGELQKVGSRIGECVGSPEAIRNVVDNKA